MADLEITLRPTGKFETVNGTQCRRWEGKTAEGFPIFAMIATVAVHKDAEPAAAQAFASALREVKVERQLVSFDTRLL